MRISDWSSDVCSSDLTESAIEAADDVAEGQHLAAAVRMDFNVLRKQRCKRCGIAIARGNEKGLRDTASLGCLDAAARPGDLDILARARGQLAPSRWLAAPSHRAGAKRDVDNVQTHAGCSYHGGTAVARDDKTECSSGCIRFPTE